MAAGISSPRLSVPRDGTPPRPDAGIAHIYDRLINLEEQIDDLRSVVLTTDGYVERRNREDQHIGREFGAQKSAIERIEVDVSVLKTDVSLIKNSIGSLFSQTARLGSSIEVLQSNIIDIRNNVFRLEVEVQSLRGEIGECRRDIKQLTQRFDVMELRMKQSDHVRFNSLAILPSAPISAVPQIDNDGTLRYPKHFPRTVDRFWSLKNRSRVHRLIELAEFYGLEGYDRWGRVHERFLPLEDEDISDSSDDESSGLTRAEAAKQYPEACHQALAATLGLNYNEIKKIVDQQLYVRVPKRIFNEIDRSPELASRVKQPKVTPFELSPSTRARIIASVYPETVVSKPESVDSRDQIFWRGPGHEGSDVSSRIKAKLMAGDLQGVSEQDKLRGLEMGWLKVQDRLPRHPAAAGRAPSEAAAPASAQAPDVQEGQAQEGQAQEGQAQEGQAQKGQAAEAMDEDAEFGPTVPTQVMSPLSRTPSPPVSVGMRSTTSL